MLNKVELKGEHFTLISVLPIYCLRQVLQVKKVNYMLRSAVQIVWSNGTYTVRRWWLKLVCFDNMFINFKPWFIARTTETLLSFKWSTLPLTSMSFKFFPFLKPLIGTFSKTLLCSLSGVGRTWISDKIFLSFKKIG